MSCVPYARFVLDPFARNFQAVVRRERACLPPFVRSSEVPAGVDRVESLLEWVEAHPQEEGGRHSTPCGFG